jgi:hypothetical protein
MRFLSPLEQLRGSGFRYDTNKDLKKIMDYQKLAKMSILYRIFGEFWHTFF